MNVICTKFSNIKIYKKIHDYTWQCTVIFGMPQDVVFPM